MQLQIECETVYQLKSMLIASISFFLFFVISECGPQRHKARESADVSTGTGRHFRLWCEPQAAGRVANCTRRRVCVCIITTACVWPVPVMTQGTTRIYTYVLWRLCGGLVGFKFFNIRGLQSWGPRFVCWCQHKGDLLQRSPGTPVYSAPECCQGNASRSSEWLSKLQSANCRVQRHA